MAKSKAEKEALKKAKAAVKAAAKAKAAADAAAKAEAKRAARVEKKNDGESHQEQNKNMKHEDFPLFLRTNFEEAGEEINS